MLLNLKYGPKEFQIEIDIGKNDEQSAAENSSGEDAFQSVSTVKKPQTLGELRERIAQETGCDPLALKLIRKGKFVIAPMDEPLKNLSFKTDKILVMGIPAKRNNGLALLQDYEKKHLIKLSEICKEIGDDITELEKNFLDGEMLKEMLSRVDKRIKEFTEACLSHLESIDALKIYEDSTTEEEKRRNREKRKTMVDGIQALLRENDKCAYQVQHYRKSLEYK